MFLRFVSAFLFGAILAIPVSAAGDKSMREFVLPDMSQLELSIPSEWEDQMRQPPQGGSPEITLSPAVGNAFQILIVPSRATGPGATAAGKEATQRIVARAADAAKVHAVEKIIAPMEIVGPSGWGYYFSATDKAPKPGEHRHMTQGIFRVGELELKFMALANDGAEFAFAETIEMLKTARHRVPAPDSAKPIADKPGRPANYRIEAGLASSQKVGCIPLAEARNTFTPPDLYKGVSECLAKDNYDFAVGLFVLAGAYSTFDAQRITNKAAEQAKSIMISDTLSQETPEKQSRLNETMVGLMKTPAFRASLCSGVQKIGMPSYFPGYMILHGIKESRGNPYDGALVKDFDAPNAWAQLQSAHLGCPAATK